jgi:uncharacterized protein Yka (UPF0111/DUF47 family)
MADALHRQLRSLMGGEDVDQAPVARDAKEREHHADCVVRLLRTAVARMPEAEAYEHIVSNADDAADALEEAAFLLSLVPRQRPRAFQTAPLVHQSELLARTSEVYLAAVRAARAVNLHDVLDSVDTILSLERRLDDAERQVIRWLMGEATMDGKLFVLTSRVAALIEQAADALTRAALLLRERATLAIA